MGSYMTSLLAIDPPPRSGGGGPREAWWRGRAQRWSWSFRAAIILTIVLAAAITAASHASAQSCLRPDWTECVSFPNGGRHTGISPYGMPIQFDVPAGSNICVSTRWEVRAEEYVQFTRDGTLWPNRDWEVEADTFCFYKN